MYISQKMETTNTKKMQEKIILEKMEERPDAGYLLVSHIRLEYTHLFFCAAKQIEKGKANQFEAEQQRDIKREEGGRERESERQG